METTSMINYAQQEFIDLIAKDLASPAGKSALPAADILADLIGICTEQDVWWYEPAPDGKEGDVLATYRILSSDGVIFHLTCLLDDEGNSSEWMGPHDIRIHDTNDDKVVNALAA